MRGDGLTCASEAAWHWAHQVVSLPCAQTPPGQRKSRSIIPNLTLVPHNDHIHAVAAHDKKPFHDGLLDADAAGVGPVVVALAVQEDGGALLVDGRIAVEADGHRVLVLVIANQMLSGDRPCAFHPLIVGAVFAGPVGIVGDLAILHGTARIGGDAKTRAGSEPWCLSPLRISKLIYGFFMVTGTFTLFFLKTMRLS